MSDTPVHFTPDSPAYDWIPRELCKARVAIWGLGLMGGSLAMALHGKTAALYGIDPDAQICAQAQASEIVDRVSTRAEDLIPLADVILLATPLGVIPQLLRTLPQLTSSPAVVIDLGSTKTRILEEMQRLPERFAPLGGHPMCGKEVRTLKNAEGTLYQGASFALVPLQRTPRPALDLALQLVQAVGAHAVRLDPLTHDAWTASISHLPYLVSNCLSGVTPLAAAPLVGPGYMSTTRLAVESTEMMLDILTNNRENILKVLHDFQARLGQMEGALESNDLEALRTLFTEGAERRTAIVNSFKKGEN
jgi:prephenate dehydrogenase